MKSFSQSLSGLGVCQVLEQNIITPSGSKINILLSGLPNDPDLNSIGITQHSTEDYLLKLLCIDEKVKEWADIDLRTLRKRANSMKGVTKLNSSKTIFAILGLIKNVYPEELISTIIEISGKKSLTSVLGSIIETVFP